MPQFNLATFPGQIFWLIAVFALQYLIIAKLIVPGFKLLFNKRKNYLDQQLKDAEELAKKAEELRSDYEKKLEEAKKEHSDLLSKAAKEIELESNAKLSASEKEFTKELHQQEESIKKAKKSIETAVDEATLTLASGLIDKIIHVKVSKKKLSKYMN